MRASPWRAWVVVLLLAGGCVGRSAPTEPPRAVASAEGAREAAARRFRLATRTEPELVAFLKRMPKGADLHNHVSGAIYSDFMLDSAIAAGMSYDPATKKFSKAAGAGLVPAAALAKDEGLLHGFLDAVSMRGWFPETVNGHDHFFATFGLIGPANAARSPDDAIAEVVRRNLAQNVQVLELMTNWAPWEATKAVQDAAKASDFEDAVAKDDFARALALLDSPLKALSAAIPPYMDARDASLEKTLGLPSPLTGPDGPITVRYVAQLARLEPNPSFFAAAAAAMTGIASDRRVVALNMVQPEDEPNARVNFETQMRMLDFLWNRLGKPAISLHAGELVLRDSPVEAMRSRIRTSIEKGHARRIGHGVSIAWEDDLDGLLRTMRERGILVEICLTSNASILGVEGDRHPLALYRRAGVPVSLNTDDEGVSRSNLTMEWVRAVRVQRVSYFDLVDMARNGLEASFLSGESLFPGRDFSRPRAELKGLADAGWTPSPAAQRLLDASPKMKAQLRFERALAAFEREEASAGGAGG